MSAPDIVSMVDEALSADMVDRIAKDSGETPEAAGAAVRAAVPGVFQSLAVRARDPAGAAEIVGAIRETSPAATLNEPVALLSADPEQARITAGRVLGPEEPALAARVAEHSGVTAATADGIVRITTPLALGALARTVSVPLGQENLLRLFREQQGAIDRADPLKPPATGAAMTDDSKRGEMSRLLPGLIIMIVLLAVLFFALRACGLGDSEPSSETVLTPTTPGAESTTSTVTAPTPPAEGVASPQPPGPGEESSGVSAPAPVTQGAESPPAATAAPTQP